MAKRSDKTPIDEIAEDAIRRIREVAQTEKGMHAIEAQTEKPRRGPLPGTGGRPTKAGARRVPRGVSLRPDIWQALESAKEPGDTLSDVIERLLEERLKT